MTAVKYRTWSGRAPCLALRRWVGRLDRLVAVALFALALGASPAVAHDAFGDLGPFYASLLHPLVDPLQAALLVGTAAFLATRPLALTRRALPIFVGTAALAAGALAAGVSVGSTPILFASAAMLVGLAALLPAASMPHPAALALVAATGTLSGLAPGPLGEGSAVQLFLGTALGIAALATLAWFALEMGARRLTTLVPMVAGSWVAAAGILIVAFST